MEKDARRLKPLLQRLEDLIEPAVAAAGFELVRVRLTGKERQTLQIMAERADHTMSADDCADLSRALSALLDEIDPIKGAYALEVSSPGIDRPLTKLQHFDDWQGYEAKIELDRMIEGRKRYKGVLGGVEDGAVVLDIEGEEDAALIPFEWIADAKLVLTDELIKESFTAAKAAENEAAKDAGNEEKTDDQSSGDRS